ncbi:MAG: SAM-dependent methyltransferase [Candidatus Sedimenticola endophacoides]|uniref:SAM-dependent methyltransferase n=1 Tax=Candidatus Sedimenticola endophacoides TaxID=2548426 RepID=A0A657Q2A5_9GAMM|nr:MAG: SAM-dependent methyltransferase [Candidatus Sedimenticola endophacoides]OQX33852.1 MAG: SAM-dependent methyltransferase [Candidatus Sedimenticola endophacoides]OQX39777.1 MAG: SAM-dependent methyltransferase [Candidatus Sedimenticola endophacoides]OQX42188.1 MAG: SAM-dependent methyltransferase [Candidatus Sedimenticola endophacoides]OQX45771.1 MAG: SAM-dependent methyltransferase [Candidatus Sedimenticola endophacoides]
MSMREKKRNITLAERADRHRLYELSVQYAASEIEFVDQTFRRLRGRKARRLREDFCGTANICCEWVRQRKGNRAVGVDIDREVLQWGIENNLSRLSREQRGRVSLLREDVLKVKGAPPDIVSAMNFSYWLFKERTQLRRYFKRVHASLADDGIFFLDAYGGYDAYKEIVEEREIEGEAFTYIWEQAHYNPIDGNLLCHIHFAFDDGSRLEKAFSYNWRLWNLTEIRELLREAGFSRVTTYWQGWDEDGEPDGCFEPALVADADAGWICYISAEK